MARIKIVYQKISVKHNKSISGGKGTKKTQTFRKQNSKMTEMYLALPVIISNLNGLNTLIKSQRLAEMNKKCNPTIQLSYLLCTRGTLEISRSNSLKVKGQKKSHTNNTQRRAEVAIFISAKQILTTKKVTREKEGYLLDPYKRVSSYQNYWDTGKYTNNHKFKTKLRNAIKILKNEGNSIQNRIKRIKILSNKFNESVKQKSFFFFFCVYIR